MRFRYLLPLLLTDIVSLRVMVFAQEAVEEESAVPAPETLEIDITEGGDEQEPPTQKKKVRIVREKETDGTQAANRFKGDPVIRSRYQLNGQPLEVDPN